MREAPAPLLVRLVNAASVVLLLCGLALLGLRGIAGLITEVLGRFPPADLAGEGAGTTSDLSDTEFWDLAVSGQRIGEGTAPVTVVVFSDYACGFCGEMNRTLKLLVKRYPQHVSVVVKHVSEASFDPRSMVALGALCSEEQSRFPEYHDASFRSGRKIDYSNGWLEVAETAGIPDQRTFEFCVRSRKLLSRLERDRNDAARLGIKFTPTFFINGERVVGTVPLPVLDSMVATNFSRRRVSSSP